MKIIVAIIILALPLLNYFNHEQKMAAKIATNEPAAEVTLENVEAKANDAQKIEIIVASEELFEVEEYTVQDEEYLSPQPEEFATSTEEDTYTDVANALNVEEEVEVVEEEVFARVVAPAELNHILDELLIIVNSVRANAGLHELVFHEQLAQLAQIQANYNAQRNFLSHERGEQFNQELPNIFGPQFYFLNFNGGHLRGSDLMLHDIAVLQVEGWLNSPGHHRNLMSAEISFTGFGIARCPYVSNSFMIYMVSGAHN